jgi:hypothetical protein
MSYSGAAIRGTYYLTITGAPLFTLAFAAWWARASGARGAILCIVIAVIYCLSSAPAWLRVQRGDPLIPDLVITESPVISALVAFTSILGTLTMLVTLSVLFDPRLPQSGAGGPLAMFIFLSLFLYGFALISAEWVLSGPLKAR